MPNTAKGLPYPVSSDPVAQGAANIQALAEAVDARIGVGAAPLVVSGVVNPDGSIARGAGFTVAKTGTGLYAITFAPAFAVVPAIAVTVDTDWASGNISGNALVIAMDGLTAAGVTIVAWDYGDGQRRDRLFTFLAVV
jgi:hypothetical protein